MGSPVFVGFQRILVAFDASPHAEHALDVALSMAGDMKAKLFVVAVIRPPEPAESAEFNAVLDDGRERYESSFAPIRERARQKEIDLETDIVVGHPAEQIHPSGGHHPGQSHCHGQAQPHHPASLDAGLELGARSQVCPLSGDDRPLIGIPAMKIANPCDWKRTGRKFRRCGLGCRSTATIDVLTKIGLEAGKCNRHV